MTQLERSIDPPGREPFSNTCADPPSSRSRAAAQRPAIPAPAMTMEPAVLCERELGLVLDVLDLDVLRAPDEDRVGVRSVHDVGDLEPELPCPGDVLVGR